MRLTRAILYTRVSTDDQAERGTSLPHQETRLRQYCDINRITIDRLFQEDYSAKTFKRPEFTRLLAYCKKYSKQIDTLLVHRWDRFSRNMEESFHMIKTLRKLGIQVQAIEQPIDPSIPEQKMMLAFYLAMPEVDNDRRSLVVTAGMKSKLNQGIWIFPFPIGYLKDKNTGKVSITPEGYHIERAFKMASMRNGITDIRNKMSTLGIKDSVQTWSKRLRNPIYAGWVATSMIDKPVKGTHPAIVSNELFLKVQEILSGNESINIVDTEDSFPLKRSLECSKCNRPLTGYFVKKKQSIWDQDKYYIKKNPIAYYKCNGKGCKENISANKAHAGFLELLNELSLDIELVPAFESILSETFTRLATEDIKRASILRQQIGKINSKLKVLEDKFIYSGLGEETYTSHQSNLMSERVEIEKELETIRIKKSNPSKFVNYAIRFTSEIADLWQSATFSHRQVIQKIVFPQGFTYDKKNSQYRTHQINPILAYTRHISKKATESGGLLVFGSPY